MTRDEATAEAKRRWGKWGRAWRDLKFSDYRVGIGLNAVGLSSKGYQEAFESMKGSAFPQHTDEELILQLAPPELDFQYDVAVDRVRAALEAARLLAAGYGVEDVAQIAGLILAEMRK